MKNLNLIMLSGCCQLFIIGEGAVMISYFRSPMSFVSVGSSKHVLDEMR